MNRTYVASFWRWAPWRSAEAGITFTPAPSRCRLATAEVAAGDIVQNVACTGTLDAVTTIDVGIPGVGHDQRDPGRFQLDRPQGRRAGKARHVATSRPSCDQARASLAKATADVGVAQAALIDATEKLDRSKALAARQLIPQSDLDTDAGDGGRGQGQPQVGDRAAAAMAQASVDQAQVDLEHAVILSPIDGIVVARKVDVGQTVAASFQTPSLFSIAADLTKMKLTATVDEADIGKVTVGPGGALYGRCLPEPAVRREGGPGAAAAGDRPERGELRHRDRRGQREAAAEAGDDGDGLGRGGASRERSADSRRGPALSADRGRAGRAGRAEGHARTRRSAPRRC